MVSIACTKYILDPSHSVSRNTLMYFVFWRAQEKPLWLTFVAYKEGLLLRNSAFRIKTSAILQEWLTEFWPILLKKYTFTHFFYYCAFCVSLRESSQFFVQFFPSNEMTHIFWNSCFLIVSLFFTFTRHPGAKKLFDIFVQSLPFFWHFISTFRQKSFFRRSFRHSSSFRRFIRTWWSGQEFWWFWWTEMFEVGN